MATRQVNVKKPRELGGKDWSFEVQKSITVGELKDMLSTSSEILEYGFTVPASIMLPSFGVDQLDSDTTQVPCDKVKSVTRLALEIEPQDLKIQAFFGLSNESKVVQNCRTSDTVATLKNEISQQHTGATLNPAQMKLVARDTVVMRDEGHLWEYGVAPELGGGYEPRGGELLTLSVRIMQTGPVLNLNVYFHVSETGELVTERQGCRTDQSIAEILEYREALLPLTWTFQILAQSADDTRSAVMIDYTRRAERIDDMGVSLGHYNAYFPDITEPVRILVSGQGQRVELECDLGERYAIFNTFDGVSVAQVRKALARILDVDANQVRIFACAQALDDDQQTMQSLPSQPKEHAFGGRRVELKVSV